MNLAIIIPALNESKSLSFVLRDLASVLQKLSFIEHSQIIVADNGSTDGTADVAQKGGARVVTESVRGYGSACLAGLAVVNESVDTVVFMDADYSDFADDLPALIAPIEDNRADLVLGQRIPIDHGALTVQQRMGNALAGQLLRLIFGFRFHDLGPFRAIRRSSLADLKMEDRAFGWTVEMQIKAVRHKLRIQEIPVRYRSRIGQSKISGTLLGSLKAGHAILWTIAKYGFRI